MSEQQPPRGARMAPFWATVLAVAVGALLPVLACGGVLAALLAAGSVVPGAARSVGSGPAVAIIHVRGVILSSAGALDSSAANAQSIIKHIRDASKNEDVRAILLRVESPGGSVVASDEIYHALNQVDKPLVVSMGELAASGGYYISANADWIVATPNTLTGSIGVISEFISLEGLLNDYGVSATTIATGKRKDFGSMYRNMTGEEKVYWQATVDEIFASFVDLVAAGRKLPRAQVQALADGSVYTGRQALANGLVDELGYQQEALRKAAELGGITGEPRTIEYSDEPNWLQLLQGLSGRSALPSRAEVLSLLSVPALQMRWAAP